MTIDLGYAAPAPQPPKRRRNARLWILAGGAAVAVAGAVSVASIASAQTTEAPSAPPSAGASPSAPASAPAKAPGQPRHRPGLGGKRGPLGFGGPRFGAGPVLHGEYVTAKPGGGYQTIDIQQGQVTAVSTSSLTVNSPDGFSKSYAVSANTLIDAQRDGIGSVKVGDTVSVRATVAGGTATATNVIDRSQVQRARPRPSSTR